MKMISLTSFFILIISTATASLCAMQRGPTPQVIVRISNMMKNQRAVLTFDTSKLMPTPVEANSDLLLAQLGGNRNNPTEEIISQYKGIPTHIFLKKIYVSTSLGIATILGGGNSTIIQFQPYVEKLTIRENKASQLRIMVDPHGYVSLMDDQAAAAKLP